MAKRNKKDDPEQKNKQGFDSAVSDVEFGKEMGSAEANRLHKEKAKQVREAERRNGDLS
ncbi:MAG TPA: hypothetical protein VNM69_03100 [Bacillus sp. (in: firmicutes)]|uniref:hypothetical protein n=1 Tax=Bacillus litorisediminis TaxID=2922713 RepID=UPI001FAD0564|nr:hypothetical protein [Bacillus litorisediminis]HWO74888.1 hypothetical protein [Bacillus sp. (in: firmicutes)]